MNNYEREPESRNPRLKLEVVRGGIGSSPPTAIGVDDHDGDEPDYPLQKIPLWFYVFRPVAQSYLKRVMGSLPEAQLKLLLRKSKLSRRHRVLVCWLWKFTPAEELSKSDAESLFTAATQGKRFSEFLAFIERHAAWHIWQYWNS